MKQDKCHLFCQRVKHCGHILQQGLKFPATKKVPAVGEWTEAIIRTPKQMKGFLGVCKTVFHSHTPICFPPVPLVDSLKRKCERAPEGGKCKVAKDRNFMEWNFKEALCEKCALYIPNDTGEYAIHTDASDFGIGRVLEQQLPNGTLAPCAFYSKRLEGQMRYGPEGEDLGFTGQKARSVQERRRTDWGSAS